MTDDFGPHFEASQGVSLGILGGFAIFQYKMSTAIKLGEQILEQQQELKKLLQKEKVGQLTTGGDKIRLAIDALTTKIDQMKKEEIQKRTFVNLPGLELRFRSPVQLDETFSTGFPEENLTKGDGSGSDVLNSGGNMVTKNDPDTDTDQDKRLLDLRGSKRTNPLEVVLSLVAVVILGALLPLLVADPMSSAPSNTVSAPTTGRPFGAVSGNAPINGRSSGVLGELPMYQGFDIDMQKP